MLAGFACNESLWSTLRFPESCFASLVVGIITRSEVYRLSHYSKSCCFHCTLDCFMCWHVSISFARAIDLYPFAVCLPHRGPVTYSGVEALVVRGRWPFPVLLTLLHGGEKPCNPVPITKPSLSPLEANTLQTWVREDDHGLAHVKKTSLRERCCCMQEQGHSGQTSLWHCFLAPSSTKVSFIFTE